MDRLCWTGDLSNAQQLGATACSIRTSAVTSAEIE